MAEWVSHLIVADRVLEKLPQLKKREFCAGNIAPDCNIPNEDGTDFIPPRKVTHWMQGERKNANDTYAFYEEYILKRLDQISTSEEMSFLLGYYSHLITDSELQRTIRDKNRVAAAWARAKAIPEVRERIEEVGKQEGTCGSILEVGKQEGTCGSISKVGKQESLGVLEENWDNFKKLFPDRKDRLKDYFVIEREYLDSHPQSGYFTVIRDLEEFPDYIDYLPKNAIPMKIKMMYYMPTLEEGKYPFIAFSREEYNGFLDRAVEKVVSAIENSMK